MASKIKVRVKNDDFHLSLPAIPFSIVKSLLRLSYKITSQSSRARLERLKKEAIESVNSEKYKEEAEKIMMQVEAIKTALEIIEECEVELKNLDSFTLVEVDSNHDHVRIEVV